MAKKLPPEIESAVCSGGYFPVVMGPTASGKSAFALELAERFGGEIISADSMQFYRGLDIGTAKPSAAEQSRVKHHLIDTMDISEKSDVFRFVREANAAICDIRSRGKLPVVAGGSGLYLRSLIYGIDELPAKQSLRSELDEKYDNEAHFSELQAIMRERCPHDFSLFDTHRRKLIRAYEVFLLSGREISSLHGDHSVARSDAFQIVITREREDLWSRIAARTHTMLESGWIEETESLVKRGLLSTPTAHQALGYPVIADYLSGGISRPELAERIIIATRQFARRQGTWFRTQHKSVFILKST